MQKLLDFIEQLNAQVAHADIANSEVSAVNIGWHVEHSCLVIIKITETIKKSNPANYSTRFTWRKWIVFLTGKFPRGKAKAPSAVLPQTFLSQEHLLNSIAEARLAVKELMECKKNQFFLHPIFGNLNVPKTIQFLAIHTHHHIQIINDILK